MAIAILPEKPERSALFVISLRLNYCWFVELDLLSINYNNDKGK